MPYVNNKILKLAIGVVIFLTAIILFLLFISPKKTPPFKDKKGKVISNSIAEIRDLEINGVVQRVVIRGKNLSNPILLHVHGGPGSPDRPFLNKTNSTLEDIFTVCYWEQRGAGASYNEKITKESMSLNQIVNDGIDISSYLKKRFDKNKIYIQGHSWGTVVATNMTQRNPNLFHAYFGIGQMANTKASEELSYDFALNTAIRTNDENALKVLQKIGRPPYKTNYEWMSNTLAERKIMRPYQDKLIHKSESLLDIYKTFLFFKEYSLGDKISALKGDAFSMEHLWLTAININLFESIKEYEIPVYFFHGKHDKTTVTSVAKEYFDTIKAPVKQYYEFRNSAHSPHIEEFKEYKQKVKIILKEQRFDQGI